MPTETSTRFYNHPPWHGQTDAQNNRQANILHTRKPKVKIQTEFLGLPLGGFVIKRTCRNSHSESKEYWHDLRRHCTNSQDCRRNLILLCKILIHPTILYVICRRVNDLELRIINLQGFITRSILETFFNGNAPVAKVLLGLSPIDIFCKNITSMFFLSETRLAQPTDVSQKL